MVNMILIIIPPVAAALTYLIGFICFTGGHFSRIYIALVHGILTLGTFLFLISAVYKNRKIKTLNLAWLFLLIGVFLFIPSGILRYFTGAKYPWLSNLLFLISLVPVIVFIRLISRPMHFFFYSRSTKFYNNLIILGILVIILAAFIIPIFTNFNKSISHEKGVVYLNYLRPLFNILLITPISGILLIFGIKSDNLPYLLIGLGFFFALLSDILMHYFLLSGITAFRTFSSLSGTAELVYLMLAGLTETLKNKTTGTSSESIK